MIILLNINFTRIIQIHLTRWQNKLWLAEGCKVTLLYTTFSAEKWNDWLTMNLIGGKYSIEFNGQSFASGVYFYRLVSDKFVEVKKMVWLMTESFKVRS